MYSKVLPECKTASHMHNQPHSHIHVISNTIMAQAPPHTITCTLAIRLPTQSAPHIQSACIHLLEQSCNQPRYLHHASIPNQPSNQLAAHNQPAHNRCTTTDTQTTTSPRTQSACTCTSMRSIHNQHHNPLTHIQPHTMS
jgi:hypothetical protein